MAKNKFYAVKIGITPGIYRTWEECEKQVKGVAGAVYKAFKDLQEAENFIIGEGDSEQRSHKVEVINDEVEELIKSLKSREVVAFVDGSYSADAQKSGFGAIIIDNKGIESTLYKAFSKDFRPEFLESRNVAAELEGVKEAINWAVSYGMSRIYLYYDYEGIEKWANEEWKSNKKISKDYVTFIKEKRKMIDIIFSKVPAHSGVEYNERVDGLAKRAILEKGYKTYNDGSIYFVGYKVDDWLAIVDCINEENSDLNGNVGNFIKVNKSILNNRERLKIYNKENTVSINCYSNTRSYVQGKQSVLFSKVIARAIELIDSSQKVIETLNHIHVLTLTQVDVENHFEILLPDYNGEMNDKHYNNLLSAVYNTMITGYMPDYTCLITPIFRAFEFYLHRILGDKMELSTSDNNGKNNFAYFTKNVQGRYMCSASNKVKLNEEQLDYLNDLYNYYNKIRHPYSHWSLDDLDTAVITDIEIAKEYLLEGLTLINKYYKLF